MHGCVRGGSEFRRQRPRGWPAKEKPTVPLGFSLSWSNQLNSINKLCCNLALGTLPYPTNMVYLPWALNVGLAAMVSQGASNTNVWAKSRALLGSISGVERARVNELVNPEPEKPLAPHWRVPWTLKQYTCSSSSHEQLTIVLGFNILCNPQNRYCFSFGKNPAKVQQRGVAATKSVLLQLLDGMTSGLNFPVLVVDLLPSRLGPNFQCDVLKKMLNPQKKHWVTTCQPCIKTHYQKLFYHCSMSPGSVNGVLPVGKSRKTTSWAPTLIWICDSLPCTTTMTRFIWPPRRNAWWAGQWANGGTDPTKRGPGLVRTPGSRKTYQTLKFSASILKHLLLGFSVMKRKHGVEILFHEHCLIYCPKVHFQW